MEDIQAPAEVVTNGEAAPAGEAANQATPDIATRASKADTQEELEKLTKEFFETEGSGTPDEAEVVAEAVADEAPEAAAEVEQVEEKAGDEPAADAEAAKLPDDEDGDVASEKGKQFRVRGKDKVEERALELKKRNRDLSLRECVERAEKEILGDTAGKTDPVATNAEPQTLEAAEAKLIELRAARTKAVTVELDLVKGDELTLQMEDLRDKMAVLKTKAQEEQARAGQTHLQEFNASLEKATGLYNFLSDEKSAGFARAREIDALLKENDDPLFSSPDKPLRIAQMVAAELRIAPKSAKAPVASPAVKPTVPVKPVSMISSGGSRTTAQSTQTGQQLATIAAVTSFEDLAKLGVRVD